MRKHQKFSGINNVLPPEELGDSELQAASNVDIDLVGRAKRRAGFTSITGTAHQNVYEANGFTLATRGAAGDLVNIDANLVLHAALGHSPRVWYWPLPDGRTLVANDTVMRIVSADGTSSQAWGVPIPASAGSAANTAGDLHPGGYQWALTHVRTADGSESGPKYSNAAVTVTTGGIAFTSLPVLAGHTTRIYLTSHFGGERFLAGETSGATFTFAGTNTDLVSPCKTEFLQPPPAGRLVAFWRGRAIVAVGSALFASKPFSVELFDLRRDFKNLGADVTLVQPVDGGIWVGTTKELVFLSGSKWDELARVVKMKAGVVLGSGCPVPGEHLRQGDGRAQGDCMVGIAGGWIVGGTPEGGLIPLTVDRYKTEATEVWSAFRKVDGVPQYMALDLTPAPPAPFGFSDDFAGSGGLNARAATGGTWVAPPGTAPMATLISLAGFWSSDPDTELQVSGGAAHVPSTGFGQGNAYVALDFPDNFKVTAVVKFTPAAAEASYVGLNLFLGSAAGILQFSPQVLKADTANLVGTCQAVKAAGSYPYFDLNSAIDVTQALTLEFDITPTSASMKVNGVAAGSLVPDFTFDGVQQLELHIFDTTPDQAGVLLQSITVEEA